MKTIIAITVLFVAFTSTLNASKYEEAMKTNIEKIFKAQNVEELHSLANKFERIAQAETDKWLPGYYAAYCYVEASFKYEDDAKSVHRELDRAQVFIDELMKKKEDESEIYALQALIYQLRITISG